MLQDMTQTVAPGSRTSSSKKVVLPSLRMAAIDIGSNSIHMVIAEVDADGSIIPLWRMKEMIGLGGASFPGGKIPLQTIEKAISALARFQQAALQRHCEKIIAVATSAVREATNGGDLIAKVARQLGINIHVINGREEARLIYLGVRHSLPLRGGPHLIIDIGGGSVEFIVADHRRPMLLESRKLGAARMTSDFVHSDPISDEDLEKLRAHYRAELQPIADEVARYKPVQTIATSGTLENLAAMSDPSPRTVGDDKPRSIERGAFSDLLSKLLKMKSSERAKLPGLDEPRKDQIVAGAVLLDEIFRLFRTRRIQMCKTALREGILLNYLSRHLPDLMIRQQIPEPRLRTILGLARRCAWYKSHSEQVARLTLELFDQLKSLHGLGAGERELIQYGALLHDIGWHISRKSHHKHSMYLIQHGELKGFSSEEVRIMANIARYHRKSAPKRTHESFALLSPRAQNIVRVGAALVRIADGLDRSHSHVVREVRCRTTDREVKCAISTRWDAQLEMWGATRKSEMFQKVFKRPITFEAAR
jgi:exopolyphosphatase/guanosine-5'-triphosphate,3'-diphosphate pyrophosphatase